MKDRKLIKNILFYIVKQLSAILFPMIVYPYVTRILGVDNLGKVEYAKSIVQYFLLFAGLGISDYAIREGARIRDNKSKLNQFSTQIIVIHIISTLISTIACIALAFTSYFDMYKNLILTLMIIIPFSMIGMNWVFCIFEEYKYISIRTICFQVISLGLTLLLVRKKEDYLFYALILVISNVGSNLLNLIRVKNYIKLDFTNFSIVKHLKPIFMIFGMALASSIYTTMDTTMLGFISGTVSVGYYSAANKLIIVIGTLIAAIRTVLLPKLSFIIGNGDDNKFKKINSLTLNFMLMFAVPISLGILCLSKEIIVLFSGEEFILGATALQLLSPEIVLSLINGYFVYQILIPLKKENIAFISILFGAIINLVTNIILIPKISQNGAAIATCISELMVLAMVIYFGKRYVLKYVDFKSIIKEVNKYLIASVIMAIVCIIFKNMIDSYIYRIIIAVPISAITYLFILLIFKCELLKIILDNVTAKIKKYR